MLAIIIFFIALWYLSLLCQTFFHHRYAAHGAFTMSKRAEKFFFILSYITQGSSYLSPRTYAILHRMHHAYTDTENDPHSPSYSPNMFHMMWQTRRIYLDIYHGKMKVEERFLKNLPQWDAMDKLGNSIVSRLIWAAAYICFFIYFSPSAWWYLLLPIVLTMGAFHGAIINWYAHKIGYRNFVMTNTSRNLLAIDILMLGESYHNNHHKRPSAINFGYKWHELDPIYPFILLMNSLGVIHVSPQKLQTQSIKAQFSNKGPLVEEEE